MTSDKIQSLSGPRSLSRRIAFYAMLSITSVVIALAALLLLEAVLRLVTDIPLQGNSRELFSPDRFGASRGNTPNIEAIAFSQRVYTDENGFRVGALYQKVEPDSRDAVLILGDSVGFGPGVEYESTFAARLQSKHESLRVYNASVIGYATQAYYDVARHILPAHPEIRSVFLVFCLNDISEQSASQIKAALADEGVGRRVALVEGLRRHGAFNSVNSFLRSRSTLYLWLRSVLTQPQERVWAMDRQRYDADNAEDFDESMNYVAKLAQLLEDRGISLTVVVMPYEFQLREGNHGDRMPQRRLGAALGELPIETIDAYDSFKESGVHSSKLFLPFDPMHLSKQGHDVLYRIIDSQLTK